jgi:hypothetical protein
MQIKKKILEAFIELNLNSFDYIIVSGSFADGTSAKPSDIDILVFSPYVSHVTTEKHIFREHIFELVVFPIFKMDKILLNDRFSFLGVYIGMLLKGKIYRDKDQYCKRLVNFIAQKIRIEDTNAWKGKLYHQIYVVNESIKDFKRDTTIGEEFFVLSNLLDQFTSFFLLSNKTWIGSGKWRSRFMKQNDPMFYGKLIDCCQIFYTRHEKGPLLKILDSTLSKIISKGTLTQYSSRLTRINYFEGNEITMGIPQDRFEQLYSFINENKKSISSWTIYRNVFFTLASVDLCFVFTIPKHKAGFVQNASSFFARNGIQPIFANLKPPAFINGGTKADGVLGKMMRQLVNVDPDHFARSLQSAEYANYYHLALVSEIYEASKTFIKRPNNVIRFLHFKFAVASLDQSGIYSNEQISKIIVEIDRDQERFIKRTNSLNNPLNSSLLEPQRNAVRESMQNLLTISTSSIYIPLHTRTYLEKYHDIFKLEFLMTKAIERLTDMLFINHDQASFAMKVLMLKNNKE